MALKIRLRPGERMFVNGAVLRNGGNRVVELDVLNTANLLHERDLMLPEEADEPLKRLYLNLQLMHMEPEKFQSYYRAFIPLSAQVYAVAMAEGDTGTCDLITDLITLLGERNFVGALKRLQKVFGRPGDARSAGHVTN